jgi:2-polyprenyl-6-methoxyphenol hydroxylase-like FAD-dependent oxidoreductase
MASETAPVLIIGAGITGLTLAQACRKENIPHRLFEKNDSATPSENVGGVIFNWTAATLSALLPDDIADQIPSTHVNRSAVNAGARPQFKCFDLSNGKAKSQKPSSERMFMNADKLVKLLSRNLNVEYGKKVQSLTTDSTGNVDVSFADGTSANGAFLAGCDGANSDVRHILHPDEYKNSELPARAISAVVRLSKDQVADARALDQFFFYGIDPRNDTFLRFSFLEVPGDTDDEANDESPSYRCDITTAWPFRPNFLGRVEPTKVPNMDIGQFSMMQTIAQDWTEPFRSLVMSINLNEAEITPTDISDWSCPEPSQESSSMTVRPLDGRVTLAGDAAHTIALYSGESADHAIMDVKHLVSLLRSARHADANQEGSVVQPLATAAQEYQSAMLQRSIVAVLASRHACMDVHQIQEGDMHPAHGADLD